MYIIIIIIIHSILWLYDVDFTIVIFYYLVSSLIICSLTVSAAIGKINYTLLRG